MSTMRNCGSSPHTRGTHFGFGYCVSCDRFIPAYAGNTIVHTRCISRLPVHPRIRGEHPARYTQDNRGGGSSPHTRGTRVPPRIALRQFRFIPAYAGNTPATHQQTGLSTVHPRIRGEHNIRNRRGIRNSGSSPHTRGTQLPDTRKNGASRFIPAYAGNTRYWSRWKPTRSVHPRIRGEHGNASGIDSYRYGSSPHTRGTRKRQYLCRGACRFIPAYAGNTLLSYAGLPSITVHPRIRGEHPATTDNRLSASGSSPHTRGTLSPAGGDATKERFIPAYAGNTLTHIKDNRASPVHPRIRGEHVTLPDVVKVRDGSSPHTRGTR